MALTLNLDDELVKSLFSGLTEQQRQLLIGCAEKVENNTNGMQQISSIDAINTVPPIMKPPPVSTNQTPAIRKPAVSRGKDLSLMKKLMKESVETPKKSKENDKSLKHGKIGKYSNDRFDGHNSKPYNKYDSTKTKKYEAVEQQMRHNLKANAEVCKSSSSSETKIKKFDSKISEVTKTKTNVEKTDSNYKEQLKNYEEFEKWILTLKTGLDSNLVPKRIIGINEYKGMIFHLVEWTDAKTPAEIIASKVLSAHYPQVVIKYYESMAVSVDIRDFRNKQVKTNKQIEYKVFNK